VSVATLCSLTLEQTRPLASRLHFCQCLERNRRDAKHRLVEPCKEEEISALHHQEQQEALGQRRKG